MDQVEIYSIMYHDKEIWIGTVDGYLMLYKVVDSSIYTDSSISIKTNFHHFNSADNSLSSLPNKFVFYVSCCQIVKFLPLL